MADGVRLTLEFWKQPGRAWLAVVAALMLGSVVGLWLPAALLDWQPEMAAAEPWRAVSAAWVHWSEHHLWANLMAALVVGAFGLAAGVPARLAWAWCAAWPLTHLALLARPELAHYGGLSGVLHAGVAITCLWLLVQARGARRWVGWAVSLGLIIKLVSEHPWGPALQRSEEWDIAVAPFAHSAGAAAGLLCGAVALVAQALNRTEPP